METKSNHFGELPLNHSTQPSPRQETDWFAMHNSYADRAKKGGVDTLFLGDSITWGMKQEILHDNFGPGAFTFGISADRTQNLLWRLQNGELHFPLNDRPKVAVVLIGINNFEEFYSIPASTNDEIVDGIKANLNELRKELPDTKILVVGILPCGEMAADPVRTRIDQINSQLSSIADNKHIFFANIGKDLLQPDGTISSDVMEDFVHPTEDKGNSLMLKAIKKNLDGINHIP
jgi:lysophospholipase L1-like esterase